MLTMPSVRTMVGLIQTYVVNKANFLGLKRYFPPDFTSQQFSQKVSWWVRGVLIGKMGPYQPGTMAQMLQAKSNVLKEQGSAFWRGAARIDEQDFLTILDISDPEQKRLAGNKLVLERVAEIGDLIIIMMEWSGWQALNEGLTAFSVDGSEMQITYGLPAKTQVGTAWATVASATPHLDIQTELASFAGTGVTQVDVVYNQAVGLLLSANEVIEDRIRQSVYAMTMGNNALPMALKALVQGDGGSPSPGAPLIRDVICYSEGYYSDANTYTPFLPSDTVFLIGSRPSQADESGAAVDSGTVGRWTSTPAIHETYADVKPGPFITYEDNTRISPKHVNIEGGINGLPTINRPTWVRRLKISAP